MGPETYICALLLIHIRTYLVFFIKFLKMNKTHSIKVPQILSESVTLPEFLDTLDKWNEVVLSIDSVKKFDDLALKLIDDDNIDVFEFHDILQKLAEDVKFVRPHDGEVITYIAETVNDMLNFLIQKSAKRYEDLVQKACGNVDE